MVFFRLSLTKLEIAFPSVVLRVLGVAVAIVMRCMARDFGPSAGRILSICRRDGRAVQRHQEEPGGDRRPALVQGMERWALLEGVSMKPASGLHSEGTWHRVVQELEHPCKGCLHGMVCQRWLGPWHINTAGTWGPAGHRPVPTAETGAQPLSSKHFFKKNPLQIHKYHEIQTTA